MSKSWNLSLRPRTINLHLAPTFPPIIFHAATHLASMARGLLRSHRLKQPNSYKPLTSLTIALRTCKRFSWTSSFVMSLKNLLSGVLEYAWSKLSPPFGASLLGSLRSSASWHSSWRSGNFTCEISMDCARPPVKPSFLLGNGAPTGLFATLLAHVLAIRRSSVLGHSASSSFS